MKKLRSALFTCLIMTAGASQAADMPATLSITGNATNADAACAININPATISLQADVDKLMIQGSKNIASKSVNVTVSGNSECYVLLMQNHIAYRFLGTADDVDGSVLANMDTSPEAAKNVGVGLFKKDGDIINLKDIMPATGSDYIGLEMVTLKRGEATAGNVNSTLTIQVERL
ncbi:TPA: type 1 fimbrial protein [Citrobacter amalonaticus]|nr:type 1 fimbrial protein [Citrobacter amalonaticus]